MERIRDDPPVESTSPPEIERAAPAMQGYAQSIETATRNLGWWRVRGSPTARDQRSAAESVPAPPRNWLVRVRAWEERLNLSFKLWFLWRGR